MGLEEVVDFGVLPKIYSVLERKKYLAEGFTVQVINLKHYDERSRVILYDGKYNMHGVLDKPLIKRLELEGFQRNSIMKVLKHSCFDPEKFYTMIEDAKIVIPCVETEAHDTIKVPEYFKQHPELNYFNAEKLAKAAPAASAAKASGGGAKSEFQGQKITSIELLSPYQSAWAIKARLSFKGDLRTWQNAKGSGKLFNVNFLDDSDEIRATAFNEVAEKLYDFLQEGKVYYISKARIQSSKPQFSRLSHPYELSLDRDTVIEECHDDDASVPKLKFNFSKLNSIQKLEPNTIVDVIGVLREVRPAFQITSKSTGKPFDRRDVTIVDDSNFEIAVGLWNSTALDFSLSEGTVVAFKGCRIQEYAGRSLTLTQTGSILANPDTPEAFQLKGWYDNQGSKETFQTLKTEGGANPMTYIGNRKTISDAQNENLGISERGDFFSVKATINFFKVDTFCYPACTNKVQGLNNNTNECNRKIIDQNDGTWRCEKCDINYNEPHYRFILNCSIMDHTGQIWITLFDSDASKIFGTTANAMVKLREESEQDFKAVFEKATMKEFSFRLKARQDSYNGTTRIRYQSQTVHELVYVDECDFLVLELERVF